MPLLGHPESEKERLASWLRPPRRARVAIRRVHRNLRHLPREALVQMLRAARAPQDYINAAKTFRCQGCDNTKPRPQTHKVSSPRPYTFNHEVGVDVFEIVDSVGMRFAILNAVCMETTYDQAWIVRVRELRFSGVTCVFTSFRTWLDVLGRLALACSLRSRNTRWRRTLVRRLPRTVWSDLLDWQQIGRVERRGAMLKTYDVESHQGHARFGQRIDGHDSQRMLERRQ